MSEIIYRPIQQKDNKAIASVIRNVFEEFDVEREGTVYSDASTDHLYELFNISNAEYWVVEEDGVIIGGCGIFPTEGLPNGCAEISKYYLSPVVRGKGIGSILLDKMIKLAPQLGYKQLYIESFPQFKKAVTMYEKLGFEHLDHQLGNSGHFACTIWMIKELN